MRIRDVSIDAFDTKKTKSLLPRIGVTKSKNDTGNKKTKDGWETSSRQFRGAMESTKVFETFTRRQQIVKVFQSLLLDRWRAAMPMGT